MARTFLTANPLGTLAEVQAKIKANLEAGSKPLQAGSDSPLEMNKVYTGEVTGYRELLFENQETGGVGTRVEKQFAILVEHKVEGFALPINVLGDINMLPNIGEKKQIEAIERDRNGIKRRFNQYAVVPATVPTANVGQPAMA